MAKQQGREKRAVAAAALAGRQKGVRLGATARELAEKHTSAELEHMAQSEAAAEAKAKKVRKHA
ncbi:hypothetical protein [Bosea sp. Root670]|uniref:hypothetical protein n=1 Tax=Bosea sp. Root670 TaxID=1736583 RepID=UPI0012E3F536|nr:hypothetical protein [Bosea sp. Root670]